MEHYQLLKFAHLIPAVLILAGFIAHCFMLWKANKGGDAAVLTRKLRVTRLYSRKAPRKANSSPKSTYRDSAANGSATWWKART